MFVTLYYPVFDMRSFLPERGDRTLRPTWPVPELSKTPFQRNLGAIKKRPLGGIRGWAGEPSICEIKRSVSLVPASFESKGSPIRSVFKRFYADGEGGAQFSIGLPVPAAYCGNRQAQNDALAKILSVELRSRHLARRVDVRDGGGLVADLFAGGTTKGNRVPQRPQYIEHGRPLILLQNLTDPDDLFARPRTSLADVVAGDGFALRNLSRALDFEPPGPVIMLDSAVGNRATARATRIILARLNLELFCFERCVALLLSPRIAELENAGTTLLLARVALAASRLAGATAPGLARSGELYDQLSSAFDKITSGQLDALHAALRVAGASHNLARAVTNAAQKTEIVNVQAPPSISLGGVQMNTSYVNNGQVGAFGENAQASNFSQAWDSQADKIDLHALAAELGKLQIALQADATTGEQMAHVAEITHAKEAAEKGDGPGVLGHLAKAGKWTLSVAEKIGVGLVVAMIKTHAGL